MKKREGTNGAANDPIARSPGLLLRKPTICIVQLAPSEDQYYYYYSKRKKPRIIKKTRQPIKKKRE
jgi:hypothetical protein